MKFSKVQGVGNDFIIVDNFTEKVSEQVMSKMAKRLCTRAISIGANALIFADEPENGGDLRMRFYNSDGSIGEMCGNGVRCLARFAFEKSLAKDEMLIETLAGPIHAKRLSDRIYKTDLNEVENGIKYMTVNVDGIDYDIAYIEIGNPGLPHVVLRIEGLADMDREDLRELGKKLRYHEAFPKGTNVNFYDIIDEEAVKLLTYERGVEDFTYACGTGSGSTAMTVFDKGEIKSRHVKMMVPGGEIAVDIEDENGKQKLYLTGDTNIVAEGIIEDEDLEEILGR